MIEPFEHNQIAYDVLCTMLYEIGKQAIIHPKGTGKSFIGFKLVENHPQQQFCWLSPNGHISHTQVENIQPTSGFAPQNIRFLTYAKLILMKKTEAAALKLYRFGRIPSLRCREMGKRCACSAISLSVC